jgi:hypothetical protein
MPQGLLWFNDLIDPLLPTDIHPVLYQFDEYEACDVFALRLVSKQIFQRLANLLPNNFPYVFFNRSVFEPSQEFHHRYLTNYCLVIERFTPDNYDWAEDYIEKIFSFWRLFSGTKFEYDEHNNPVAYQTFNDTFHNLGENPVYVVDYNEWNLPEVIVLNIPPTVNPVKIVISYLYRQQAAEALTGYREVHKHYEIVKTDINKAIPYAFNVRSLRAKAEETEILPCSIVINCENINVKNNISEQFQLISRSFLYSNIDDLISHTLSEVENKLTNLRKIINDRPYPEQAVLIYATNNYWGNGQIKANVNLQNVYYFRHGFEINVFEDYLMNFSSHASPDAKNYTAQEYVAFLDNYYHYSKNSAGDFLKTMPDSLRTKKILYSLELLLEQLGTSEWIKETEFIQTPKVNIWHYLTKIARIIGISLNPDRSIRPIRQRAKIEAGKPIPPGWPFGQWGENVGEAHQKGTQNQPSLGVRDGIAIESIPNQLSKDVFGRITIKPGGYVLCENLMQVFAEYRDQDDAALGLQEAGANAIPNADGSGKIITYEGMHSLLAEIAYTSSKLSQIASQTNISSATSQALLIDILLATGLPTVPKTFPIYVGGKEPARMPYPGLAADAPTLTKQIGWVLSNLSILVSHSIKG